MIELKNLSFSYGETPIFNGLNCTFRSGRFYGIFGANGSGKSTLLKMITGELKPDSGVVQPCYKNVLERAQMIGFMEQHQVEMLPLTVQEVVALGSYPWRRAKRESSIEPVLDQLHLQSLRNRAYNTLSGGEKQRVMLARILAQNTPVLLLDEPFSSLDFGNQHHFYRILKELAEQGKCVIMVSHDVFVSADYLDEALFLKDGRIYCQGAPGKIFSKELFSEIYMK